MIAPRSWVEVVRVVGWSVAYVYVVVSHGLSGWSLPPGLSIDESGAVVTVADVVA